MLEVGRTYPYKSGKGATRIQYKRIGKYGEYFAASNGIDYDAEGRRAPGGLLYPNNMTHRIDDLDVTAYTNTRETGELGGIVTVATDEPIADMTDSPEFSRRLNVTDIEDHGATDPNNTTVTGFDLASGPDATTISFPIPAGYYPLAEVLIQGFQQAATGKGNDRHANGKPFIEQPILEIVRMLDGVDGHAYQIMKKAQESSRMVSRGQHDAAIRELYGVINYAAAAVIRIREMPEK